MGFEPTTPTLAGKTDIFLGATSVAPDANGVLRSLEFQG
jgi:hypothetical protein